MICQHLWLVKDPSLLLQRVADVIGSAIVFFPHKGKYVQTFQGKPGAPHLGLAGEIEVEGSLRSLPLAVSDHLLGLVSGGLCLPSDVAVPPTVHLESPLPLLPAFSKARCHCL